MWELIVLRAIDTRAGLLGTEDLLSGAALDKYTFIRSAYLPAAAQSWSTTASTTPKDED